MNRNNQIKYIAETSAIIALITCLNLLLKPSDPGFSGFLYLPFAVPAVFCAVYYNRITGIYSLLASVAAILILQYFKKPEISVPSAAELIIFSATLLLIYLFGTIRESDRIKILKTREHLRKTVKELYRIRKISAAQLDINRELEDRIAGQRVSITTLYNQMHKMDSLNLAQSLDTLIETILLFTEATAVTIWNQGQSSGFLQPAASRHSNEDFNPSQMLNMETSIEGWVFRNNRMVSARMINNIEQLKKMDTGKNLITMPIPLNKAVWGVLNIEEMPFVKYNSNTERLLDIIISLSEPALSRAVEHERQISLSETDNDTNLPLFSQMYNSLSRYIASSRSEKARISLMVIEMQNFTELRTEFPPAELKKLFLNLTDEILLSSAGLAEFYMFKSDNQMAVLIPGVDSDGTSLLCLEILEKINSVQWTIGSSEVFLEMIIGYSSLGENAADADGLINHAEHLLEIQKI